MTNLDRGLRIIAPPRDARVLLHKEVFLAENNAVRCKISRLRHQAILFTAVDMQQTVDLHPYRLLQSYWVHVNKGIFILCIFQLHKCENNIIF